MGVKGMVLMEQVMLIIVVVIAIIFMQTYVRRAVQGKIQEAAQDLSMRYEYGGKTSSNYVTNIFRNIITNVFNVEQDKYRTEITIHNDDVVRTGNETISY